MTAKNPVMPGTLAFGPDGLEALIRALAKKGYQVLGPIIEDDAIVYGSVGGITDLPKGIIDRQEPGRYRLEKDERAGWFSHTVGPYSWKRFLYPPKQTLFQAQKTAKAFKVVEPANDQQPFAFIGVRACEMAALDIHQRVFDNGDYADKGYLERREKAFIVAVNCVRAGDTCFCVSMDSGPKVSAPGWDLRLTELVGKDGTSQFLLDCGSDKGAEIAAKLPAQEADNASCKAAKKAIKKAAEMMGRSMISDAREVLARNLENPHWEDVGKRCLNCANCTMVCPTCFCTTMEDVTSLDGSRAERNRLWDSCFTVGFSYIHGGSLRRDASSRYRQWITHKLTHWYDQFDTSGCTGCGRCITWCPVGIDITEEARAIKNSEGKKKSKGGKRHG